MKIYYTKMTDLSETEKEKAFAILPAERVERIRKRKTWKSQMQSLAAGLLLEYALHQIGLSGKDLTFLKNQDGKPYIKEMPQFFYNLSHSGEYVALVMDEYAVGIDIEREHKQSRKLAERFFAEEEKAALRENWSEDAFTKVWTRKESFLKVTGFGMRMPLNGFSVVEKQVQINEKMPADMVNVNDAYYIASYCLNEDCWLSVCRKEKSIPKAAEPERIEWKEVIKGIENV